MRYIKKFNEDLIYPNDLGFIILDSKNLTSFRYKYNLLNIDKEVFNKIKAICDRRLPDVLFDYANPDFHTQVNIYINSDNIDDRIQIRYFDDEYYILIYEDVKYLCDQLPGLEKCLEKIIE